MFAILHAVCTENPIRIDLKESPNVSAQRSRCYISLWPSWSRYYWSAGLSSSSEDRKYQITRRGRRTSSPLRAGL